MPLLSGQDPTPRHPGRRARAPPPPPPIPAPRRPRVSVQDLTHRYPGGVTALEGLSLELEPGIIGFVGANGAGKSTFIKILLGLLTPTHGTVRVLERDAVAESLAVRQLVGY